MLKKKRKSRGNYIKPEDVNKWYNITPIADSINPRFQTSNGANAEPTFLTNNVLFRRASFITEYLIHLVTRIVVKWCNVDDSFLWRMLLTQL